LPKEICGVRSRADAFNSTPPGWMRMMSSEPGGPDSVQRGDRLEGGQSPCDAQRAWRPTWRLGAPTTDTVFVKRPCFPNQSVAAVNHRIGATHRLAAFRSDRYVRKQRSGGARFAAVLEEYRVPRGSPSPFGVCPGLRPTFTERYNA
jgi:hypothetical protein